MWCSTSVQAGPLQRGRCYNTPHTNLPANPTSTIVHTHAQPCWQEHKRAAATDVSEREGEGNINRESHFCMEFSAGLIVFSKDQDRGIGHVNIVGLRLLYSLVFRGVDNFYYCYYLYETAFWFNTYCTLLILRYAVLNLPQRTEHPPTYWALFLKQAVNWGLAADYLPIIVIWCSPVSGGGLNIFKTFP